jgi:hypothetical protein
MHEKVKAVFPNVDRKMDMEDKSAQFSKAHQERKFQSNGKDQCNSLHII